MSTKQLQLKTTLILMVITLVPPLLILWIALQWPILGQAFDLSAQFSTDEVIRFVAFSWLVLGGILIWWVSSRLIQRIAEKIEHDELELSSAVEQLKAAEEYIAYSDEKYQVLIENMNDVVWVSAPDGKVIYINEACKKILGYSASEIIGKEFFTFMCPLHDYNGSSCFKMVMNMADEDYKSEELWMLASDETTRRVLEVNTRRVIVDGRTVEIQGVGRDVTDRIQANRQLIKKNKQLEILNQLSYTIVSDLDESRMQALFEDICQLIIATLSFPLCTLRMLKEDKAFHLIAAVGKASDWLNKAPRHMTEEEMAVIFRSDKAEQFTPDQHHLMNHNAPLFQNTDVDRVLYVPLYLNHKPFGILSIFAKEAIDDSTIQLLESIGYQITLALEKSDHVTRMKDMYIQIIDSLISAIEAKDVYTQGHSKRVARYAVAIARKLGLAEDILDDIEIAGLLHDVGKIGIADAILTKAGKLTAEEYEEIQRHPEISMKILEPIGLSKRILEGILYHHCRYDLTGYPQNHGLDALPPIACIVGVADSYDAMTSNRSYKGTMSTEAVKAELLRCADAQFCERTVLTLIELIDEQALTA